MGMFNPSVPSEVDRVRRNTPAKLLEKIDTQIAENIHYYSSQPGSVISGRIAELEAEWSIERWLETNASSIALGSLILGATVSRKWLLVTGTVLGFLFQHAIQGWCPPVPALRALGIRTRSEIDRERFALKFLRGDFKDTEADPEVLKKDPAADLYRAIQT